jgi:hypothetical protein
MKRVALSLLILTICMTICAISKASVVLAEGGATGVGDGGTGVVCTSPGGLETFELLDLYEAKEIYGLEYGFEIPLDLGGGGDLVANSYRFEIERLQIAFESLSGDQTLSSSFALAANVLLSFRSGLANSYDVNPLAIPLEPNCELRQIGFRYTAFSRTLIEIDSVAWQRLDSRRRALLVIHEALHEQFPTSLEGASALRQVVAYIAAPADFQIENRALIRRVIQSGRPANVADFRRGF